ncbi:MAG: hypothetical protein MJA83_01290, partial [Gammaproteobacteria bacterium]|nr:hypothetical protein [Gammaproteobacteria bacterium]
QRLGGVFPMVIRDDDVRFSVLKHRDEDWEFMGSVSDIIRPGDVISSPELWGGFLVGAVFIVGAIMLRRYRDES